MKLSLSTTFSSLMLTSTIIGIGIVVLFMFNTIDRVVEPEKNRTAASTQKTAQIYFENKVSTIGEAVQFFVEDEKTQLTIINNDKQFTSRLLLDLNQQSFPFSASILYINRGQEVAWLEAHKFITGTNNQDAIPDLEMLNPSVHHRIVSIKTNGRKYPVLVYSSNINSAASFSIIGSIRAVFNLGTNSTFLKEIKQKINAECVTVSLKSDPTVIGSIGPDSCVSMIQTESKNLINSATKQSYFLDDHSIFLRSPLSESSRLQDLTITSLIKSDILAFHKEQLWRTITLLSGILLLFGVFAWVFSKWYIQKNVRKLVELVARDKKFTEGYVFKNNISEFQLIGNTYQEMQSGLAQERSRKEIAQNDVKKLNSKLKTAHLQKMEALGTLTASVAHDFNNILTIIRGNLDLFEPNGHFTQNETDRLSIISASTDRATKIVKNLLLYVRNDQQLMRTHDLLDEVEKFAALLPSILGPTITFSLKVDTQKKYPVYIDADKFASTLMNLTINARDAMPDGGKLTLKLSSGLDENGLSMSLLTIEDTGFGMTEELVDRVFDPFFTTKEIGSGTGLGLSIVHEFVENCNGSVDIVSQMNIGTCIKISIPSAIRIAAETVRELKHETSIERAHILIADDEPFITQFLKTLLERQNAITTCVATVSDAKEVIKKARHFDCLICDMHLPDGVGTEIITAMKKHQPKTPILVMSGYDIDISELGKTTEDPQIKFIQKPLSSEAFLREISMLISSYRAQEFH